MRTSSSLSCKTTPFIMHPTAHFLPVWSLEALLKVCVMNNNQGRSYTWLTPLPGELTEGERTMIYVLKGFLNHDPVTNVKSKSLHLVPEVQVKMVFINTSIVAQSVTIMPQALNATLSLNTMTKIFIKSLNKALHINLAAFPHGFLLNFFCRDKKAYVLVLVNVKLNSCSHILVLNDK